jgi:hypothetical protein
MQSTTTNEEKSIRSSSTIKELLKHMVDLGPIETDGGKGYCIEKNIASVIVYSRYNGGPKCYSAGEQGSNGVSQLRSVSVELLDLLYDAKAIDLHKLLAEIRYFESFDVNRVGKRKSIAPDVMITKFGIRDTARILVSAWQQDEALKLLRTSAEVSEILPAHNNITEVISKPGIHAH